MNNDNGNGTHLLKESTLFDKNKHNGTDELTERRDSSVTPVHRRSSGFTGAGNRLSKDDRTRTQPPSQLARQSSTMSSSASKKKTNPNMSPAPKGSSLHRKKSRKAPRPFALQPKGMSTENPKSSKTRTEGSGKNKTKAKRTRDISNPKTLGKTKGKSHKKSGKGKKQGSESGRLATLKSAHLSLEPERELGRRDSEGESANSITSMGTYESTYSSNNHMKNPRAWKKHKQRLAEKHRSRTPAGFGMTLKAEKKKKKRGTAANLDVVRGPARLIIAQLKQASTLLSSGGRSSRKKGEIPVRQKQKVVVGRTPIGLGGFSTVYPGTRWRMLRGTEDSYELAVKMCELDPEAVKLPEELDQAGGLGLSLGEEYGHQQAVAERDELLNEVMVLDMLDTPTGRRHVARLLDCYELEKEQRVCLIMERYTVDLDDPSRARIFDAFPVAKWVVVRQVVEALTYLQKRRIIHGDLKPSNLLISKHGIVRLCDFGLAKRLDADDEVAYVDKVKGSPEYMAPELLEEGMKYDYSVDIWSLGVIIYALWNRGETMFDQYQSITMRCFSEDYWIKYRENDQAYFNTLLGTRYLTPEEHVKMQPKGAASSRLLQRAYTTARAQVEPVSNLVRGALLPLPEHALEKHKVVRPLDKRIELKVIRDKTNAVLAEHGFPSAGRQNNLMIQVVRHFLELEQEEY